jgi:methylated-DNA-[protein]-cysteine S-methyltransferase
MKYYKLYHGTFCTIGIAEEDGAISNVFFARRQGGGYVGKDGTRLTDKPSSGRDTTPLLEKAAKQLDEYFNGKRKAFDLPLSPHGTDFQIRVWKTLQTIPYGQTRSYGQIAAQTGNPKASRAVGMANNRNPIAIIIPCHRVIGADGSLTGYAGGLELKQQLLEIEGFSNSHP